MYCSPNGFGNVHSRSDIFMDVCWEKNDIDCIILFIFECDV